MRGPLVGAATGHVDDRKCRVGLSGLFCDLPTVHSAPQTDVDHKCPVGAFVSLEKGYCFFARWGDSWLKAAFDKGVFNDGLYFLVIFDDQDHEQLFQRRTSPDSPSANASRASRDFVPGEVYKSELSEFEAARRTYSGGLSSLENRYL